ncbi:MAG: hypothetical protein J6J12_05390 [Oscillospiraceae bacterium]|nr:hypothetical protein [Oscillospiraceae bacterium]
MKRLTCVLLVLMLLLCGCGGPAAAAPAEYDLAPVLEANQVESLVAQYDNYIVNCQYPDGTTVDLYMDRDSYFSTDGVTSYLFTPEEQCVVSTEPGMEYFDRYLNLFGEDMAAQWRMDAGMGAESQYEKVVSWEETDGVARIGTELEPEYWSEDLAQMGYVGEDGDVYICEYEVESETNRILRSNEYIRRKDGTVEPLGVVTFAVNGEKPEQMQVIIDEAKAIDALPGNQTRTVTCVVDPGSTEERTLSKTVLLGSYVMLPENMNGYALFLDAEGTEPVSGLLEDVFQDSFTVYALQKADAT